jgi:hypothetical protein
MQLTGDREADDSATNYEYVFAGPNSHISQTFTYKYDS